MIVGTTVKRNIVDLLDLPPLDLEWFVATERNDDGTVEVPMQIYREHNFESIDRYTIKLMVYVWEKVSTFEAELRKGPAEVVDNLQPLRRE